MNIIVPLGGLGTRFQNEGYWRPKPFVRVLGKEMILWVLDNLDLHEGDTLVIVFNPKFLNMDMFMQEIVQPRYPSVTLVELAGPTRGAAETVLLGIQALPQDLWDRPCVLCDGDCFYTRDIVGMYREVSTTHNATFTFHDTQQKPIYSYVTVDTSSGDVIDIKEKVKISDNANTGCYCFRSGVELARYCELVIKNGLTQLSQDQKGEFYTSGVIKIMLEDKIPCRMLQLNPSDFHVLGTPVQVRQFCELWTHQPRKTVVFALMGTVLDSQYRPIERHVSYVRQLYEQGHSVVLSCSSRPSAAVLDVLQSSHVPYTALDVHRPVADFYVDTLAIDPLQGQLSTQMGIGFKASSVSSDHESGIEIDVLRKSHPSRADGGAPLVRLVRDRWHDLLLGFALGIGVGMVLRQK